MEIKDLEIVRRYNKTRSNQRKLHLLIFSIVWCLSVAFLYNDVSSVQQKPEYNERMHTAILVAGAIFVFGLLAVLLLTKLFEITDRTYYYNNVLATLSPQKLKLLNEQINSDELRKKAIVLADDFLFVEQKGSSLQVVPIKDIVWINSFTVKGWRTPPKTALQIITKNKEWINVYFPPNKLYVDSLIEKIIYIRPNLFVSIDNYQRSLPPYFVPSNKYRDLKQIYDLDFENMVLLSDGKQR